MCLFFGWLSGRIWNLLGSFFGSKCHAIYNILATQGALGEISLPCSENVVRALLKFCYGLPYDANLGLEDELVSWIRKNKNHGTLFDWIDDGIIYDYCFKK